MRPRLRGDNASLVNHFLGDGDKSGPLHDLQTVVVTDRHHSAGQPARDTAHIWAEILGALGQANRSAPLLVTGGLPASGFEPAPAFFGQRRDPAVWWIDDHRDLRRRRGPDVPQRNIAPLALVAPDAAKGGPFAPRFGFLRR